MSDDFLGTHYIPKSERESKRLPSAKKLQASCESCEYYDYDEDSDAYVCQMSLDEDEMIKFLSGSFNSCPYYKYYDEYKSVHKQI